MMSRVMKNVTRRAKPAAGLEGSTSSSRIISLKGRSLSIESVSNGDYHYHLKALRTGDIIARRC